MRLFFLVLLMPFLAEAQPYKQADAAQIRLNIEKLKNPAKVLYIAAHPDDENTRLLSWMVSEKKCKTAYLSLTRGDGGQNLIGTEKAELLGIIRTQELLAARSVDGAEQFFSRAVDFGYSKKPEETFEKWGKDEILSDVVWVIRNFKPDIIITRFPTTGEGGHGHHTASAMLAVEAFEAAANQEKFPWQLKYTQLWQPKRLLWNTFQPQRNSNADTTDLLKLDVGGYNALLGSSYGEIASKSRSMHKSQGFGSARNRGPQIEWFKHLAGERAQKDIFENVILSVSKIQGGAGFEKAIDETIKNYNPSAPEKSIPYLLKAHEQLNLIKNTEIKTVKRQELEQIILDCAGLFFEAFVDTYSANPGQQINTKAYVLIRNNADFNLKNISIKGIKDTLVNVTIKKHEPLTIPISLVIPFDKNYTNPFWLQDTPQEGLFQINDTLNLAAPKGPSTIEAVFTFSVGNKELHFTRPLVYKWVSPVDGELYRDFEVIPEVMVNFNKQVYLFKKKEKSLVNLTVKAGKENVSGNVKLILPRGWRSEPESQSFLLNQKEEEMAVNFIVLPPSDTNSTGPFEMKALANSNNKTFNQSITRINYDHIPVQTLINESKSSLSQLDISLNKIKIAYIPGADDIPIYLEQLGYEVSILTDDMLEALDLNQFKVIITGIRAYNTNNKLKMSNRKLLQFVENGGNLIVQYNTSNFTGTIDFQIGPYPFKIGRNRVTDENAEVEFTKPTHALLNFPNKITSQDFEGWVQERGIYFAEDFQENYQTVFSMHDKDEKAQHGSLIVTHYGKGSFIYTGISFFRQLPAGVPGAYRLFVNLISYTNQSGARKQ
ncbi:MAG: PIG-L family deacetylase [Bacteroidetes bacterium]|nr:PIG-L family deacetylase [Bacteroidota bacterium]HET6245690.1 PIG-L family deacetylase [Bacteroidia bacterium]